MNKVSIRILSVLSFLAGLGAFWLLFTLYVNSSFPQSLIYGLNSIFALVVFSLGTINFFFASKYFFDSKQNQKMFVLGLIFVHLLIWPAQYLIGYLLGSSWFLLAEFLLVILTFFFVFKVSKFFIIFPIITLLLAIHAFIGGYEERYCVEKGKKAELNSSEKFADISEEEKKSLGFAKDDQIFVNFYEHMKCHRNFNFWKSLSAEIFFKRSVEPEIKSFDLKFRELF